MIYKGKRSLNAWQLLTRDDAAIVLGKIIFSTYLVYCHKLPILRLSDAIGLGRIVKG